MAISGLVLFLFAVGHLIGNLQIFLGPEAINRYGAFLQGLGDLLWAIRLFMATMLILHIWSASRLTLENRAARPVPYTDWNPTVASYASRTMFMGGVIIFCFIVFHLLHYTVLAKVGGVDLHGMKEFTFENPNRSVHDIYRMLIVGFSVKWVSAIYMIGVAVLALHLSHGVKAMVQSLGLKQKSYDAAVNCFAAGIAVFIFVGYASIPVAIMLGILK
jgi:succinate dehydrogenase / fumarate reductase, cytochrome b subunit